MVSVRTLLDPRESEERESTFDYNRKLRSNQAVLMSLRTGHTVSDAYIDAMHTYYSDVE